ncbi:hypothetical protein HDE_01196 [Halotydeus destructor]|nr:hypothetical protein HDE_01196 [Halotydeus destructor]
MSYLKLLRVVLIITCALGLLLLAVILVGKLAAQRQNGNQSSSTETSKASLSLFYTNYSIVALIALFVFGGVGVYLESLFMVAEFALSLLVINLIDWTVYGYFCLNGRFELVPLASVPSFITAIIGIRYAFQLAEQRRSANTLAAFLF